jgi:hypothetical protein
MWNRKEGGDRVDAGYGEDFWFPDGSEVEEGEEAGAKFERMNFDEELFYGIVGGMFGEVKWDERVRKFLEGNMVSGGRDFGGVPVLLRCIMQGALYELSLAGSEGRSKIVVADYVAVGDAFFGAKEVSLLSGLLSKVLREGIDES